MPGAQNVLDLAVCLGVVGPVLHQIQIRTAHREGRQRLGVFRAGDEGFGIGQRGDPAAGVGGHIDAFWLSVPDVGTPVADPGEGFATGFHCYRSGGRNHAGFIARDAIVEMRARLQLDDVEIGQRHMGVIHVHDGPVLVVEWRDMHRQYPFRPRWARHDY